MSPIEAAARAMATFERDGAFFGVTWSVRHDGMARAAVTAFLEALDARRAASAALYNISEWAPCAEQADAVIAALKELAKP